MPTRSAIGRRRRSKGLRRPAAFCLALGLALPAAAAAPWQDCNVGPDMGRKDAGIGRAEMRPDGTLVVTLRAGKGSGAGGGTRFLYAPGDEMYCPALRYLGGLRPGETKPVPPWDPDRSLE
jgi:hypothetical protein